MDFNKYENYIEVGASPETLAPFPTPSSLGYLYADVDKDPFTDLAGYTHRNRVRHDVLSLSIGFNALSENDLAYILNAISPEWFYVRVKNRKTKQYEIYKMYASDKQWNTFRVTHDESGYHEVFQEFTVTFVQE